MTQDPGPHVLGHLCLQLHDQALLTLPRVFVCSGKNGIGGLARLEGDGGSFPSTRPSRDQQPRPLRETETTASPEAPPDVSASCWTRRLKVKFSCGPSACPAGAPVPEQTKQKMPMETGVGGMCQRAGCSGRTSEHTVMGGRREREKEGRGEGRGERRAGSVHWQGLGTGLGARV